MPRQPASGFRCVLEKGIATLELAAPLLDERTARDLCAACERIELDESVCVVVLRAPRGLRVSEPRDGDWPRRYDCFGAIAGLSAPVIAEVGGDTVAEGCELALAADLRFAAARARFRLLDDTADYCAAPAAEHRLAQLVGRTRALEVLGGRAVRAREALRIGLVDRVVPPARLRALVRREAATLARKGPIALRYAKEAVWKGLDMTFEQGVRLEQDLYVLLQTTDDRREGIRSFLEKRPPRFRGR